MNEDIAWKIIVAEFAAGRPLQDLIFELKENLPDQEYQVWLRRIGTALHRTHEQLVQEVLKEHPELEQRIESQLEKSGRIG